MYNYTDLHLHTIFSWDAKQTMEEVVTKAKTTGINVIGFTEHIDLMDKHNKNYLKFDYDKYSETFDKNKKIFPGILKGIEVGELHVYSDRFNKFVQDKEFDYFIGSLHFIGDYTPVFDNYFRERELLDVYRAYFDEEYKLIKYGGFEIAAHITLVHRYGARYFSGPLYQTFKKEIDDILKLLINKKIAVEINTSGLHFPAKDFIPDAEIIKAYIDFGGDMITVGSDAHIIADTFNGLKEVYEMLEDMGVKETTVFEKHRPKKIKIKS